MNDIAIRVTNVSKSFKLPHEKHTSLKSMLFSTLSGKRRTYEKQEVLKDISFEIKKGEFFGIVGRNGSGKSTLLKLLAGIYSPDEGHIQINGKLTPFIELGVGFDPDLTGRENVFLNGALFGFSRNEMESMYDEIVRFAELDRFMDQKLKNYSSGMQVRLAFSIAVQAKSEILLLDEVLAVGDESFQKKCYEYFAKLKAEHRTVILVSHDMESVKRYCDRALLIENGHISLEGDTFKIAEAYSDSNLGINSYDSEKNSQGKSTHEFPLELQWELTGEDNQRKTRFLQEENILLNVSVTAKKLPVPVSDAEIGISISDEAGQTIFIASSTRKRMKGLSFYKKGEKKKVCFTINNIFSEGNYEISVAILDLLRKETYVRSDHEIKFSVITREKAGWLLKAPTKIEYLD